jgi:hypothetical protein
MPDPDETGASIPPPCPEGEMLRLLHLLPERFEQADSHGAEYTGDGLALALFLAAVGLFFVNVALAIGFLLGAVLLAVASFNLQRLQYLGLNIHGIVWHETKRDIRSTLFISCVLCLIFSIVSSVMIAGSVWLISHKKSDIASPAQFGNSETAPENMTISQLREAATQFAAKLREFQTDFDLRDRELQAQEHSQFTQGFGKNHNDPPLQKK